MALTPLQRTVCHLLAAQRRESGESYVAGGVALNTLTGGTRLSRDIDLFHDTTESLEATWQADYRILREEGYDITVLHERTGYVEAEVSQDNQSVLVQWVRDSAYRFFPLVAHAELGLTLHPFDLATNKTLALVGRLEIRDWIDLITCHEKVQPLGYLAWAACGKDPGFSPLTILEQAARSSRYTSAELQGLSFEGPPPDMRELSQQWHVILQQAHEIIERLPAAKVGTCVLDQRGQLYQGDPPTLGKTLATDGLVFHPGSIRGVYPSVSPNSPE